MGILLIGITFGGYIIGLVLANNLSLQWHVIYTLFFLGITALIIAQFAIHKIVIESLSEIDRRTLIIAYMWVFILISCIMGGVTIFTSVASPMAGVLIATLGVILNTAIIGYLSKRFWASFFLNLVAMLFFTILLIGVSKAFSIESFMWLIADQYTNLIHLLLVVACVFGGLFGLIGKYKQYTKPPITLTTPIDASFVYRDRLSVMMLLGKNNFPEYETKGDKVVFYNRMDVKMGFRPKHEIRLDIKDEETADVYLEKFAEREKLGTYRNPNKLREQFQPIWNLLGYALKGQLAKLLRPILLLISIVVVIYNIVSLTITVITLGLTFDWALIAAIVSVVATVLLLAYFFVQIVKKMESTLKDHPEFSIAFIGLFVGVFLAAFFVPLLLQGALIAVSTSNLVSFKTLLSSNLIYLFIITAIVGLSSIQVLGVQNFNTYFYHRDINVFKHPEDEPSWLDDKAYWVFRYAYEFPGEFTVSSSQVYHEDIERMDVWVNARTGIAEWLVGDYHWREIWTRIPKSRDLLIGVNFSVNFHTPVYYVLHKEDYEKYCQIKTVRQLLSYFWDKLKHGFREFLAILAFWTSKVYRSVEDDLIIIRDPPRAKISDWSVNFFTDVPAPFRRACADYIANIPWNFLRYPYGVDNVKHDTVLYRETDVTPPRWPDKVPTEPGKGIPAMDKEQICPRCGYVNKKEKWVCDVCKTDVRKYTAYTLNAPQRLKRVKGWFRSLLRKTEDEKKEQERLTKLQEKEKLEEAREKLETHKKQRKQIDKFSDMFLSKEKRERAKEKYKALEEEQKTKYKELKTKTKPKEDQEPTSKEKEERQ